ncbi:TatD family hydrolase [Fluviispira multicolorata]|uniref:YchF/TatD family DNA exonuclease n=1 Tax=Fluviispira multicolorata TaxID=2654512 RepID=A0A833JE90_9BACT|nr:TatD family hydrolase [Fluviispira multicolorata]KAB8031759.1 YchF/TatD family DNA exonuclease [Fluviispira multicolorata]
MQLIDTHCHLVSDKLKNNLPEIIERAKACGVQKIINIAYDPATITLAQEQIKTSEILYATLGIQPHDASQFTIEEAEKIRPIALNNQKIVGIGEIGLDGHYTLSPMGKQIECFEYFLQMALELNLPIVVHMRETHTDVYSRIKQFAKKGLKGVIHCFTGTLSEAKDYLAEDFYLSFSGIVTFKNAIDLQEVAKYIPENRILIETDSPYLSPVPLRGKTNEPSHILHTCEFIAKLRNINSENFAKVTAHNAETLFYRLRSPD